MSIPEKYWTEGGSSPAFFFNLSTSARVELQYLPEEIEWIRCLRSQTKDELTCYVPRRRPTWSPPSIFLAHPHPPLLITASQYQIAVRGLYTLGKPNQSAKHHSPITAARRGNKVIAHDRVVRVSSTSSTTNILRPNKPPWVKFRPSYQPKISFLCLSS